MNENDDSDWKNFLKSVKPIEKKNFSLKTKQINNEIINAVESVKVNNLSEMDVLEEDSILSTKNSFDKKFIKKIRKGQINIDAKLDLHGFKLLESKKEVFNFVSSCYLNEKRLLLIITGKGKRSGVEKGWIGRGVLKENLPNWLNSQALSKYIIWHGSAPVNKGGEGATNVYLKKFIK